MRFLTREFVFPTLDTSNWRALGSPLLRMSNYSKKRVNLNWRRGHSESGKAHFCLIFLRIRGPWHWNGTLIILSQKDVQQKQRREDKYRTKNSKIHIVVDHSHGYQNAHQPEKHWQRFSRAVDWLTSFSICSCTVNCTSGLKSRPDP